MEKKDLADCRLFLYSFKDLAPKEKVKFLRDFFGYKQSKNNKEYSYLGLLDELNGAKLSKNTFLIPDKHSAKIKKYLKTKGVDFIVK